MLGEIKEIKLKIIAYFSLMCCVVTEFVYANTIDKLYFKIDKIVFKNGKRFRSLFLNTILFILKYNLSILRGVMIHANTIILFNLSE